MKRPVKIMLLALAGGLILMQFFRPEKNLGERMGALDMLVVQEVPEHIAAILEQSCYDCHSEHTVYPWYSGLAPFSWYLAAHVRHGKEEADFSLYGELDTLARIGLLAEICEVAESGSMPLASYTLIHRRTKLGKEEVNALCEWVSEATAEMLKK